jgi:glycosyltransferase involved in cell wall biosynthesis
MKNNCVRILVPTFNGAKYLPALLDSLLSQDHSDILITLSDDGSTDETLSIIESYANQAPERITHYRSGTHFGCAEQHFMHLLRAFSDDPYVMFCDQDDVWHTDKVRKTLVQMRKTEPDPNIPTLVHTDLRVVDASLNVMNPSFCRHSGIDGNRLALNQLLVQNVVTGCTVMINKALADLANRKTAPDTMRMHDWWLALLASACGRIGYLNEATIDYRQHGSNSVGAKDVRSPAYLLKRLFSSPMRSGLRLAALQAGCFAELYGDLLTAEQRNLIEAFASTADMGLLARDRIYIRHNLLKSGFVRRISQLTGL